MFGILTLCRILYTVYTQEIASKAAAAEWALELVDPRWHALVERVLQRYERHDLAGRDWLLARRAMAFADYIKEIAQEDNRKTK